MDERQQQYLKEIAAHAETYGWVAPLTAEDIKYFGHLRSVFARYNINPSKATKAEYDFVLRTAEYEFYPHLAPDPDARRCCSMCGKKLGTRDKDGNHFVHHIIGSGSQYDRHILTLNLCCRCLDSLINYLSAHSALPILKKQDLLPESEVTK